jgi:hypothetical protein
MLDCYPLMHLCHWVMIECGVSKDRKEISVGDSCF